MCEYCNGNKDISDKLYEDGSKFSDYVCKVWIDNSKIFGTALNVSPVEYYNGKREQYNIYSFYINYCPMCGRKLTK